MTATALKRKNKNRPHSNSGTKWSGNLGFILSLTGAAVGLGNIWRFPYLLDQGGAAFIIMYALSMLLLVLPIMYFEIKMGQVMQQSPIISFQHIIKRYKLPKFFSLNAYLGLAIVFCVFSFYTVVSGWVMYYLVDAIFNAPSINFPIASFKFDNLIGNPRLGLAFNALFLLANYYVLGKGVKSGLEGINKLMMPGLFVILILLLIFAGVSADMSLTAALIELTEIDYAAFNSVTFLSALGQALFTLAVGASAILTYGAYLAPAEEKILLSSIIIIIAQLVLSFMLGLVIYSLIIGQDVVELASSGPSLIFTTLPVLFAKTNAPQMLNSLFFLITFFAAITSSINIAEPMIFTLTDKYNFSRKKACRLVIIAIGVTSSLLTLSFYYTDIDIFGRLITLVTEGMMPLAAFIFSLLGGWYLHRTFLAEIMTGIGSSYRSFLYGFFRCSMRYLFPVAILIITLF